MKTVLVPLADGCEEMEAITITDILTRAGAKVTTAAVKGESVIHASRGAKLVPDASLSELTDQSFDLIALPGGLPGADTLAESDALKQLVTFHHQQNKPLAAVCAAPKALARFGIFNDTRITAYPGVLEDSNEWHNTGAPIEVDGHIVTGRGPGVVLDFALTLVEQLYDEQRRCEVEEALVREK